MKKKLRYVKILLRIRGGDPPDAIFWHIAVFFFHTFCLLLNLFWTFPLKSIGFLRFQLIFRWFFNDFSGFSAYFLDILQRLCGSASGQKAGPHVLVFDSPLRHVGAGLLSFVLSYITKRSPPERREAFFASFLVTKSIVFCHTDASRLSGGDLFMISMTIPGVAVLGGTGGSKLETYFWKN